MVTLLSYITDNFGLLLPFTFQVRGVKPLLLLEMANLFNSLRLMVCPGLVSSHQFSVF